MKEFRLQPKILFGEDSLDYLKTLEYKKVMIITDGVITQLKLIDLVTNNLSPMAEIKVFDKVEPNPSVATIENGLKDFVDFDPECVIALGGGSSIDACKGILYFAYKLYKKLSINKEKLFFVAIPTTSGTGSEVTSYSVVTQGEHKIALANDLMLPDVALLSTKFLSALPAKVVADTGMDVLTHALEAYVSTNANPFASALAMKSIKLIFENLVTHYNDRKIEGAKENVQFASCLAGIAFDNSSLGINHSIAHSIGAKFHIAHGRANAIVSRELGLPAGNVEEGKSSLLSFVRILKEKLGIEKCLKDYGADFEEFKKEIPDILLDIKKDMCTVYNPNKLTDEEYIRLLLKIYFGE